MAYSWNGLVYSKMLDETGRVHILGHSLPPFTLLIARGTKDVKFMLTHYTFYSINDIEQSLFTMMYSSYKAILSMHAELTVCLPVESTLQAVAI